MESGLFINESVMDFEEDWEEEDGSNYDNILDHLVMIQHNDEYSYDGYRICFSDDNGRRYYGNGKWSEVGYTPYKINDELKGMIINGAYITSPVMKSSELFKKWTIDELIDEFKRYNIFGDKI